MSKPYPKEVSDYIVNNYSLKSGKILCEDIRKLFKFQLDEIKLRQWASKHGLVKHPSYSSDQNQWLIDNCYKYPNSISLTEDFNKRFNLNRTSSGLKAYLRKLVPEHKFSHSGGLATGKGFSVTSKPVGSETFKGGYWWIKYNDKPLPKKYTTQDRYANWKMKHRYIWEKYHGDIPEGCKVIFLDGDRNNFSLDNLYCADTRALLYLMRNNMWYESGTLTLSAIKWAELKVLLSGHQLRNYKCSDSKNT